MARKITPLKYKKSPFKRRGRVGTLLDQYEGEFEGMKTDLMETDVSKNFYDDLVNPYAGLTDHMASLENTAEDLTVNQKAFTQQERMLQQSLSSTLEQSKRTGTQNVQAIANQLSKSTGDISASMGEQERQNQMAKASQASELGKLKAQSAQQLDMQTRQGEFQVDMQQRKGEEDALARDLNKQQALLSLVSGQTARADEQRKRWWRKIV